MYGLPVYIDTKESFFVMVTKTYKEQLSCAQFCIIHHVHKK